jgi:hypothetical protein
LLDCRVEKKSQGNIFQEDLSDVTKDINQFKILGPQCLDDEEVSTRYMITLYG